MKKALLLLFCLGTIGLSLAQVTEYTVETVPNTKLVDNSYVSNPDTILSGSTVAYINSVLGDLEKRTTVQVAVVCLKSIGNADHFEFAQGLFDRWKIGQAKKSNGLLILLVQDQHKVRLHTGYGLEGVLPDILCKQIEMNNMVPYFKTDSYDEGIKSGVDEVVRVLTDPSYADELMDDERRESEGWPGFFWWSLCIGIVIILIWYWALSANEKFSDSKLTPVKSAKTTKSIKPEPAKIIAYPKMKITRAQWIIEFGLIPVGLLLLFNFIVVREHILYCLAALYGYAVITLLEKRIRMQSTTHDLLQKKDYHGAVKFYEDYQVYWLVMGVLFAVPMILHYLMFLGRKNYFRNHPRDCKSCGKNLIKLDEKSDDEYLQKSQIFEEELKSVDYDVWKCSGCGNTEVLNYLNLFSKYQTCGNCKTRAFYLESDRTLSAATYSSSGTGERTHRCKFCHHKTVETYTIPMKTRPSDNDSSSGSGSGSSGSSGGSWGGGSSGGGGASSSW